jgi:hypothetical protein
MAVPTIHLPVDEAPFDDKAPLDRTFWVPFVREHRTQETNDRPLERFQAA